MALTKIGILRDFLSTGIDDNATSLALTINSSGNVGIGSTDPANRLQVKSGGVNNAPTLGSINSNAQLYLTNNDTAYGLVIGNSSADGHVWIQAQRTDGTATAYNITLNEAGGNVGIGTDSPGAALDIKQSSTGVLLSRVWNPDTSGTGAAVIRIANNGNNNNGNRLEFSDASYYTATISGDRTQGLIFRTSGTGTNPTTIPERMRISNDGIVSGLWADNTTHNASGKFVKMTQAQYNAITPDSNTIYFIT